MNFRRSAWGTWALGLIGSLAAHVGILVLLLFTIQPEPVTDQPMPTSELEVQAYQLDRTEAREQKPDSQRAMANTPDGTALDAGAIPQSRAKPAPALAETLRATQASPRAATQMPQAAVPVPRADPASVAIAQTAPRVANIKQTDFIAPTLDSVNQPLYRVEVAQASPAMLATIQPMDASVPQAQPVSTDVQPITAPSTTLAVISPASAVLAAVLPPDALLPQARPAVPNVQTIATPAVALAETSPAIAAAQTSVPEFAITKVAFPAPTSVRSTAPQSVALPVVAPNVATSPSAKPKASALLQTFARPGIIPPSAPEPRVALSGQIAAPQLPPAAPRAQKLKAALAFSGGDGNVDPVSIAAFQSFMQPGDTAASGDQLRDGVAGLLAKVPCSRMQVAFDPDTATLQVNGHIPDDDLRAPVLAALRSQMGANITISDNILILPRPQCGALSGIAGVGLPQSTDQITNPLVIGEDAQARVFSFTEGDLLSLDMTAPDYDAYIYLDYFDADGMVLHLEPNEYAPLRQTNAQAVQQIGARTMLDKGLKLMISPPYGQEIAVAFAASAPLYDGLRPIQEPAEPYLAWLKTRVEQARTDNADFKGEWIYFFVSTEER